MALIWGLNSQCSCPVCLIPHENLWDHATDYHSHTSQDAVKYLERWKRDHASGKEVLKAQSLWPVVVSINTIHINTNDTNYLCIHQQNSFWFVKNSDPHQALCFDPLHTNDHGMWGNHLFIKVKAWLEMLGHDSAKRVDGQ